jgi:TPP-dependent pyruvate/acetoin dehydrogenase alpha subunit
MAATALDQFRWMLLARMCDERLARLKAQGEVPGSVFTGKGQEAYSAAIGLQLRRPAADHIGDVFAPLIRDGAGRLAFGEALCEVFGVHLGRATTLMKGRDGNIHRGDPAKNLMAMISHLGAMLAPVNGILLARRLAGTLGDSIGAACLGDGAMNTGATHEALNQAAVERLPLVVCVADNQLAYSTFRERTAKVRDLSLRAAGYGMGRWTCDGTDPEACLSTVASAFAAARAGEGPQMVVAQLFRMNGHGTHDDAAYVPEALRAQYADCLEVGERQLLAKGLLTAEGLAALRAEAAALIAAEVELARSQPHPTAAGDDWRSFSVADLRECRAP